MSCCTKRACNIHYTKEALQDLGYFPASKLEYLTCHELQPQGPEASGQPSNISRRSGLMVPLLAVLAFGFVASTALALVMLWRNRKAHRNDNINEVKQQIEMHPPRVEMHGNEQEDVAHVERQPRTPRMLQMDLLATSDSWRTVSVEGAMSNGAVPVLPNQVTVRLAQNTCPFFSILAEKCKH
jgi:hypothetical protein